MKKLFYDFHLHSCLSPCGDNDMTPNNIVNMAQLCGLDAIALTDHNTCRNCPAVGEIARRQGLLFIPGMELTTAEEVHVLCLFPTLDAAMAWSEFVYAQLPPILNDTSIFGEQRICNALDEVTDTEKTLLISATGIDIYQVQPLLDPYGAIAIPAHVNRNSFSLITNLGFYDPAMRFSCMELTLSADQTAFVKDNPTLAALPHIQCSDAHNLEDLQEAQHSLTVTQQTPQAMIAALRDAIL